MTIPARFVGTGPTGRVIIGVGLTAETINAMKAGQFIQFPVEAMPGCPFIADIFIIFGETDADLAAKIRPTVHPGTSVVVNNQEMCREEDDDNPDDTGGSIQ